MGLRQQWNSLRKFGNTDVKATEASQQILCCDSSAALGMIKRKGSTRKTRHIELKAFFRQQWCARPEVRLVQVGTSEVLADCLTKIVDTKFDTSLEARFGNQIQPSTCLKLGRKDRAEAGCALHVLME